MSAEERRHWRDQAREWLRRSGRVGQEDWGQRCNGRSAGGEADDLAGGPRAGRTARAEIPRIIASRRAGGMPHALE